MEIKKCRKCSYTGYFYSKEDIRNNTHCPICSTSFIASPQEEGINEGEFWALQKKYNLSLDNENYNDLIEFYKEVRKQVVEADRSRIQEEIEKLKKEGICEDEILLANKIGYNVALEAASKVVKN